MLSAMRWWVLLLAVGVELSSAAATAQEEKGPTVTRVVALNRLEVSEAVKLVEQIYAGDLEGWAGAEGIGRIVLHGNEGTVTEVENMLRRVDAGEATDRASGTRTEYIGVQTYPVEQLMPLLTALDLDQRHVSTAVDQFNRQLVVTGLEQDLKMVKDLIAQVDLPQRSLALNFFFIQGTMGAKFDPAASKLPPNLTGVGTVLGEGGLGESSLMGTLTVRASSGEKFESNWTQSAADSGGIDDLGFDVSGMVRSRRDSNAVELALEATVTARQRVTQSHDYMYKPFKLRTTLSAGLDQYVVIAAAPSTTQDGTAIALAVRVTRD